MGGGGDGFVIVCHIISKVVYNHALCLYDFLNGHLFVTEPNNSE